MFQCPVSHVLQREMVASCTLFNGPRDDGLARCSFDRLLEPECAHNQRTDTRDHVDSGKGEEVAL